jgi:uncharacterized OsmC-like protein
MGQVEIAAAIGQARAYLTANPAEARYRDGAATASVEDGLRIRVSGADGASMVTDMVAGVGGGATAPGPGWMFRAALASCVATFIAMRVAEAAVTPRDLRVVVDSESDDRGILGIDPDVPAGPLSVRVVVSLTVDDGVEPETVRRVVDEGVARCPVYDLVVRPRPVEVVVEID